MKRVLLLSEFEAKNIVYCAHKAGHHVIVAGELKKNRNLSFHPMCRKFIPLENELNFERHTKDLIPEIISILRSQKIDVLIPSSFDCIRLLSRYRDELGKYARVMPVPSLETIDMLDNKYSFYLFCREHGLAHPESHYLDSLDSFNSKKLPQLDYPIMLKPVLGAGEEGLKVFKSETELYDFFRHTAVDDIKPLLPALLQVYFEGEDIDFNGFAVDGELKAGSVMRTQFYTKKPSFNLTEFVDHDEVWRLGAGICKHSQYSGPLNIDMRIRASDGKVQLIEVNPRFWARGFYSLMDGMNFIDLGIRSATGDPIRVASKCSGLHWVSSLSRLVLAMIINRDAACMKYMRKLSRVQLEYILFNRYYNMVTKLGIGRKYE
jgi:predicted ATP-grasp superfamily ATP-dependent carboligase